MAEVGFITKNFERHYDNISIQFHKIGLLLNPVSQNCALLHKVPHVFYFHRPTLVLVVIHVRASHSATSAQVGNATAPTAIPDTHNTPIARAATTTGMRPARVDTACAAAV